MILYHSYTAISVFLYFYLCILILLYLYSYTAISVFLYCYICILILLYLYSCTAISVFLYCYICILKLLSLYSYTQYRYSYTSISVFLYCYISLYSGYINSLTRLKVSSFMAPHCTYSLLPYIENMKAFMYSICKFLLWIGAYYAYPLNHQSSRKQNSGNLPCSGRLPSTLRYHLEHFSTYNNNFKTLA